MWDIFLKVTIVIIGVNLTVAPLISILFNWLTTKNLSVEHLYHPVPFVYVRLQFDRFFFSSIYFSENDENICCDFSLPWNQSTALGYVGELCHSLPIGTDFFSVIGTFLLLFISMSQHHQAFYNMFKHTVDKLKQPDGKVRCDAKFLRDLIRFYISVKK